MRLTPAFLLEVLPNASQCSTSPSRTNEAIKLTLCLLPNFRTGGRVVSICVGSIIKLVCPNSILETLGIFSSLMIIVLGVLKCNSWDGSYISTEHTKEVDFFLALKLACESRERFFSVTRYLSVGHVDHTFVAFCSTDVGEANACISCSAFYNCASRLDSSIRTFVMPRIPDGQSGRTSLDSLRDERVQVRRGP